MLSVCSFCLETIPSFEENNCYIKVTEDYNTTLYNDTNKPIWIKGVLPDGSQDFGYLDKEVQRQDFDPQRYVSVGLSGHGHGRSSPSSPYIRGYLGVCKYNKDSVLKPFQSHISNPKSLK